MKIIFPEQKNPIAKAAIKSFPDIDFVEADNLDEATEILALKKADSLISGLDYSSRDVLVACRDHLQLSSRFFSSCFICKNGEKHFALADGGVNKSPNDEKLYTIVEDTAKTFEACYAETPRIAMLSYSKNFLLLPLGQSGLDGAGLFLFPLLQGLEDGAHDEHDGHQRQQSREDHAIAQQSGERPLVHAQVAFTQSVCIQ